jgi:glycosyltransferase involved in cell wall biosynthesis
MDKNLVSIIIPCFNREAYLAATLESCLAQTYPFLEIIIVDDGSTDSTLDLAKQYADQNHAIKVVHTENQGQCAARNLGLSIAQGTYIKFLDSDDLLLPQAIASQLQAITNFQADIAVCGAVGFWTEDLDETRERVLSELPISSDNVLYESLLAYIQSHNCTFNEILISKRMVTQAGGFEPSLKAAEEINLLLKLAISDPKARVVFHPEQFLLKRLSYGSLAYQIRQQTQIPYLLLSLQQAGEFYLESANSASDLKSYIFDRLYQTAIFAYRDNLKNYATTAMNVWQKAALPFPLISPWYHHTLHQLLGFELAELSLSKVRDVRALLRK